jgi:hypothetical protein
MLEHGPQELQIGLPKFDGVHDDINQLIMIFIYLLIK